MLYHGSTLNIYVRIMRWKCWDNEMNWNELKNKYLGYGALKDEEQSRINLSTAVTAKSRFDHAVSHVVTELLMQLIIPWIDYCFNKYTEEEFHRRMSAGFDFIHDLKVNHLGRYNHILRAIRAVRNRVILDEKKILTAVLKELNKRGWTITEWEKGRFREDISVLIKEIYS